MPPKKPLIKMHCDECNEIFENPDQANQHWHTILTLSTGGYLILLPTKCPIGSIEAVESFAKSAADLRQKHPGTSFSFLPFSFSQDQSQQSLTSILAVASSSELATSIKKDTESPKKEGGTKS